MSRYFSESEFKKCVPSCSERDIDRAFLSLLDEVRERAGILLVLNCAYRSSSWDKSKGRSRNYAHTRGKAVYIRCNASATRFKIVKAALECGVRRIGIGKSFVHLDNDNSLPQDASVSATFKALFCKLGSENGYDIWQIEKQPIII